MSKQSPKLSAVPSEDVSIEIQRQLLAVGDTSKLSIEQKTELYNSVCASLGLNSLTRPLDFFRTEKKIDGKYVWVEQLYARKDCTDQLRSLRGVSITSVTKELVGEDLLVVTASALDVRGRTDTSSGAVSLKNFEGKALKGENLANAYMKCETKAKRRVTLSICGLGFLDETEVASVLDADAAGPLAKLEETNAKVASMEAKPDFAAPAPETVTAEVPAAEPIVETQTVLDEGPDFPDEDVAPAPGDFVITCGRKNRGKRLSEVPRKDLETYRKQCTDGIARGIHYHPEVLEQCRMIGLYLASLGEVAS